MRELITKRRELSALYAELNDIYTMSDEAACACYNVESKQEIIDIMLKDHIRPLETEIADIETAEEDKRENGTFFGDPAFPTAYSYFSHIY